MSTGTYEYKSEFARRYFSQGEAQTLLKILRHRFTVSEAIADRVLACTDIAQLETWTDRALVADTLDEVFES